ncbi:MAG: GntR family transcriptional regulator [Nocardiopsaceae bacterium]|nr:GntR family transcriptional regulator [Nocardiopsaceae bacterium]
MQPISGISIHRVSTATQVAEVLTELILKGEIPAGEHLRESALAESTGVSRNTVREAIRLLEQSGLVRHQFNAGAVIIEPSIEDLADLYRVRRLLESCAVSAPLSRQQLAPVRRAYAELAAASQEGDMFKIVARDVSFHQSIVALAGSSRLDAFYSHLMREMRFYLQVLSMEDREYLRPKALMHEHDDIMRGLEDGEPMAAAQAVQVHVDINLERLSAILRSRQGLRAAGQ